MAESVIGGSGFEADIKGAQDGSTGGGEQLLLNAGGKDGRAAKKLNRGGGGDGQNAVGALDSAAAGVEGGAVPGSAAMCFDGNSRADDVDDGIFGADLVKVDRLGRTIVNFGLGMGEEFKGREGKGLGSGADGSAGDDLADFGESSMDVRMRVGRGLSLMWECVVWLAWVESCSGECG